MALVVSAQDTSKNMVLLSLNQYVADILTAEALPKTISGLLALILIRIINSYGVKTYCDFWQRAKVTTNVFQGYKPRRNLRMKHKNKRRTS